jgi:Fe-S-cluster containining protein
MCGNCCRVIRINLSPEYIANRIWTGDFPKSIDNYTDMEFAYLFWKPITMEKALEINPYLKTWPFYDSDKVFYYTCTKFDESKNLCTVHETRPRVCSEFPWYGEVPGKENSRYLYSDKCGYIEEVMEGTEDIERNRQKDHNTTKKKSR